MTQTHQKELARKSLVAIFMKGLSVIINFAFLSFSTHYFGAKYWGMFALTISALQFLAVISSFGLDIALVNLVASSKLKSLRTYTKLLGILVISNATLTLLAFYFTEHIAAFFDTGAEFEGYLKIMLLALLPFCLMKVNAGVLRGQKKIAAFNFFESAARNLAGILVVLALLVFNDSDPEILFIGAALGIIVSALFSFTSLKKLARGSLDNLKLKAVFQLSFPIQSSILLKQGVLWFATFIGGYYLLEKDLGIFDGAFRIANLSTAVLFAVNSILAPKVSEMEKASLQEKQKLLSASVKMTFLSSLPFILILMIFPEPILGILLGKEFIAAKTTLMIILVGQLVNNFCGSVGTYMQMTGLQKQFRNITLISFLINACFGIVLTPKYGIEGLAVALVLAIASRNIFGAIYIYKKTGLATFFNPKALLNWKK